VEILDGKITNITPSGLTIFVPYTNIQRACLRQYAQVQVGLPDGRTISPEQRRKAYALMGEVAAWSGYNVEEVKLVHKREFIESHLQGLQKTLFSLSNCDLTTAREFISYLIDFMIEFGVPAHVPLYEMCEDIQRYVYQCLMHKRCVVCGKDACLHHCGATKEQGSSKIGMGGNRKTKIHEGLIVLPLCWGANSHHDEVHQIEQEAFNEKYHLYGIPATKEICQKWGLKHECD
jgi:hypothetical protein